MKNMRIAILFADAFLTGLNKEAFEDDLYEWYNKSRASNLAVSRPVLQQMARDMAVQAGVTDFRASNYWPNLFKKYHNICCKSISGERGDINRGKNKNLIQLYPLTR